MHPFWTGVATLLVFFGLAHADERNNSANANAAVGIGMVCNSPEQIERYISLLGSGQRRELAMNAVNTEANDPQACGVAAVAFTRDAIIDSKTVRGRLLQVVRINIIAGFDGVNWQPMSGKVQYAAIEPGGMDI
jgi:hypothetical protein